MLPNSSSRPAGHHPPHSIPCLSATSSAARSTPVCPPEMILSAFTVAAVADRRRRATNSNRLSAQCPRARSSESPFVRARASDAARLSARRSPVAAQDRLRDLRDRLGIVHPARRKIHRCLCVHASDIHLAQRLVVPFVGAGVG